LWLVGEAWYELQTKRIRVRGLEVNGPGLAEAAQR